MRRILLFLPRLWANWITLSGSILTTVSSFSIILFVGLDLGDGNPYLKGLGVMALPVCFVLGLLLIPIGLVYDRWKVQRGKKAAPAERQDLIEEAFSKALLDPKARGRLVFFGVMTAVNVLLFASVGKATVEFADSPKFCGQVCHGPMQPEWETYNRSPHAHVACVQCHIGPGTTAEVKAKLHGTQQMYGLLTNDYDRPVPTPVVNFRSATETCAKCHWPDRWIGNRLRVYPHFKDDQANTPVYNAEFLHVGGKNPGTGKFEGIHQHANPDRVIKYQYLDEKRHKIGAITVVDNGQVVAVYEPKDASAKVVGERTMDCVDCHSRPTHIEEVSASVAVDHAMADGRLDAKQPFIKQVAVAALATASIPHAEADGYFRKAVADAYQKHADAAVPAVALEKTGLALAELYRHNIFPEMKVTWGTYPNQMIHDVEGDDAAGCFRCHDDTHKAKLPDGKSKTLSQECSTCHEQVANEDDPAKFDATLKAGLSK